MCVLSGEVFSGPSRPHKGRVVPLDSLNPARDHWIYMQENCRVCLCRSEIQVWLKMGVSSGEVFSGALSPHKASVVTLDSQNPVGDHMIYRQEIVAFILRRSELRVLLRMCVSTGEVFSGPSSPHKARVVSLDSQNPAGGPFDM